MISPQRALADLDPSRALVYTWFDSQFDFQGKRSCLNLGKHPLAPRVLTMGDGTTANTIPSQIVGRHGISLGGTQYVDTGLIDPFERTDRFTLFVQCSAMTSIYGIMIASIDVAQDYKGVHLGNEAAAAVSTYVVNGLVTGGNYIQRYKSGLNQRKISTFALVNNGTSLAAGVNLYHDGAVQTTTTVKDTLSTGTIKNGKRFLVGARWNGAAPTNFLTGNIHFAAIYPFEATPQQVQYLDRLCKTRVNQP